jgi:hypothetical protein
MRLATAVACLVCLADGFAQSSATLDAIRYPPLAAAAQVQGDVLVSGGNVVTGPTLLREAARQLHAQQTGVLIHFILIDVVLSTKVETIQKGDAVDRFFLRLFRISATKKVEVQVCTESANPPANRIDSTKDPIEVWVYGKARCIETQASYTGTLDRS